MLEKHDIIIENQHYHDINPIVAGWESCPAGSYFGPTSRDFTLLHYVVSGEGSFCSNGRTYELKRDKIFVIRPNEVTLYANSVDHPLHYIWIGFEANVPLPRYFNEDILSIPEALPIFSSMLDLPRSQLEHDGAYFVSIIWQLISLLNADRHLSETSWQKKYDDDYVSAAINIIEKEFPNQLSVTEIAQKLHLERSYFSRIFHAKMGLSPKQYIFNLRMQRAAELLQSNELSVAELAAAVGYDNLSSFSRAFKQYYGCAPMYFADAERPAPAAPQHAAQRYLLT